MTPTSAFFYQVLKPGRYLGGETGLTRHRTEGTSRKIIWFYPDRYERAITDPAWRRAYFQLDGCPEIRLSRAVEYARDVWTGLRARQLPVFTVDGLEDIRQADAILFWAPDALTAAHIPSLVQKAGLDGGTPPIGVLVDGLWMPRFLLGHVDWIALAPGGWLSRDLVDAIASGRQSRDAWPARTGDSTAWLHSWRPGALYRSPIGIASRWVPRVEVEDDYVDVDLSHIDGQGNLRARDVAALVVDALQGLKETGCDGIRFCGPGLNKSETIVAVLIELQRRHNLKRVRAHWPAITVDEFARHWSAYKPHLLKPVLRLRVDRSLYTAAVIEAGHRALNSGWQGLTAVMEFDSFEALSAMFSPMQDVLAGWSSAAATQADKRPLRLEYCPSPLHDWKDGPDGPAEDDVRRYASEFRHFKEDMSRYASVGTFRIDEIMTRNWLSATNVDLWDRLAELDLSDSNDPEAPAFDWFTWIRQCSGLTGPPNSGFLAARGPEPEVHPPQPESSEDESGTALSPPSEDLFGRRRRRTGFTRRLVAPPLTRMRVRWGKEMPWRLYSHLDVVRAIERAVRRSGLPASYSEGFHPRLKLSFGPPLAFGLLSDAEYFDLVLEEEVDRSAIRRLEESLPDGLRVIEARGVPAGMPALSDTINEAVLSAFLPLSREEAQNRIDKFNHQPDIRWRRVGRDDSKPVDPRKTLREVRVEETPEGTRWTLTVFLAPDSNIRPTDWPMLLFGFTPEQMAEIVIRRTALMVRRGQQVRTPFDPV